MNPHSTEATVYPFSPTRTTKAQISALVDDLIHHHIFELQLEIRRVRALEKRKVSGSWFSLPLSSWDRVHNASLNAKAFFAALRRSLGPEDYRLALQAARGWIAFSREQQAKADAARAAEQMAA